LRFGKIDCDPPGRRLESVGLPGAAALSPGSFWPGQPVTAHWGVADPAAFQGTDEEKRRFFFRVYRELENRIKIFTSLRIDALDSFAIRQRAGEIGRIKLP
jgi:arsenate reductase